MSIRPAERRLPDPFLPLDVANRRAVRWFLCGLFLGALPSVAAFIERVLS